MQHLTIKEYAIKHKISIFNVMKMVKSQQLKTITKEENGKEVVYILPNDTSDTTPQQSPSKDIETNQTSLQEEIKQLQEEVAKLRSELNRLKVTVFKMAKEDAKVLKI
jgi:predicted RNase H-like nuclease (RuvC/YqgF family)